MKMEQENAEALYARFDFLDPKERLMESGFGCPDSWVQLLWNLCERIENELERDPKLKKNFRVLQTTEKWGTLRFYVSGENDKIKDMIEKAMEESQKIGR